MATPGPMLPLVTSRTVAGCPIGPPVLVELVADEVVVEVVVIEEAELTELPPPMLPVELVTSLPPAPPEFEVSPDVLDVLPWQPASEDQTASIPVAALMPRNIILPLRTMRLLQECRERKASTAVMAANARPQASNARVPSTDPDAERHRFGAPESRKAPA